MIEKKYYVKLKLLDVDDEAIYLTVWHEEDVSNEPYFYPDKSEDTHKQARNRFTKSELAEIMDGALYRLPVIQYNSGRVCPKEEIESDTMGKFGQITRYPEWINPLIELVPVEDGE